MTGRLQRRRAVVVAGSVLAAALVVGLVWRGGPAGGESAPAGGPPLSTPVVAGTLSPGKDEAVLAGPSGPASPQPHGPDERQVCGGRWVKVEADGQIEGDAPDLAAEVATLRKRLVTRLRADRDEYARAVGVWMDDPDGAVLVDLALGTRDPRVYGLAFRSCRQQPGVAGSACALLSAAQWTRLDPENAAPWLFALADTDPRKDAARVDEALFQISRSTRNEGGAFRPLQPLLEAAPMGDASLMATFGVVNEAIGRMAAMPLAPIAPLRSACRGAVLADANRSQVCGRVAEVMAERSDDLLDRHVGGRMVTELTGSSDRQTLQRAEMDAWADAMVGNGQAVDVLGCGGLRSLLDRLREQAVFGETGAIRRWVDRSGLTPKELIGRASRREAARAAAASAAAAASGLETPPPGSAASSSS